MNSKPYPDVGHVDAAGLLFGVAGQRLHTFVGVLFFGEVILAERARVLAAVIVVVLHDLRALLSNVTCLLFCFLAVTLLSRKAVDSVRC